MSEQTTSAKIILYGHAACPGVGPAKVLLTQANAEFEYINIHQDPAAAERVRSINNGYESVPTLVFPDDSTLTEPSFGDLKAKLETLGYRLGPMAWLIGNFWRILIFIGIGYALLRSLEVL